VSQSSRPGALNGDNRPVKATLLGILLVVLVFVGGLGMLGGGVFLVVVQLTGTPATARIAECHDSGGRYHSDVCTGTWVTGGSLLAGGRVVLGTVDGADSKDVGHTLDVRLSGSRAYTTSLRVPIVLIVLGLAVTAFGVRLLWIARRARARAGRAPAPRAGP
jgi:hypothetical protein